METEESAAKAGKNHDQHVPNKLEDGLSSSPIIIYPHENLGPTHSIPQPEENPSPPSQDPSSQMKSPPIQTMGSASPPAGYDPNRIPTSIFCAKPTNPAEWSVASNESLFSIHMGNNSFSRDYAILFGKSGDLQDFHGSELPRLDNPGTNPASLPSVMESPPHEETKKDSYGGDFSLTFEPGVKMEKHEKVNETKATTTYSVIPPLEKQEKAEKPVHVEVFSNSPVATKAMPPTFPSPPRYSNESVNSKNEMSQTFPSAPRFSNESTNAKKATPQTFPSPPRFSNESGNSGSSFAFPVLNGESGKPDSLKVVPEHSKPQTQDSKETPNAPGRRWFSYFLFWPRCC